MCEDDHQLFCLKIDIYRNDADFLEHLQLQIIAHVQNAADECILPCIEFDTARKTIIKMRAYDTRLTYLLILARSSLINLVR